MTIWELRATLEPTVLIAVGFVLFAIPEPATSTLGIGLMLLGIAWWVQAWRSPSDADDGGDGRRVPARPRR